jgi:N-acylneuraminate cytidylyltransferase
MRELISRRDGRKIDLDNIKMFLTDCDGCMTDGGMYLSENGDELKKFAVLDGMGLSMLHEQGILTGMITGESRELNRTRAKKLHMDIYVDNAADKLEIAKGLCEKYDITMDQLLYVGDDVNDLSLVEAAGLGVTVPGGRPQVKAVADYITETPGGQGAIREMADMLLGDRLLEAWEEHKRLKQEAGGK